MNIIGHRSPRLPTGFHPRPDFGPTGIFSLNWDAATTRFQTYSYTSPPPDLPAPVVPPASGMIDDDLPI